MKQQDGHMLQMQHRLEELTRMMRMQISEGAGATQPPPAGLRESVRQQQQQSLAQPEQEQQEHDEAVRMLQQAPETAESGNQWHCKVCSTNSHAPFHCTHGNNWLQLLFIGFLALLAMALA